MLRGQGVKKIVMLTGDMPFAADTVKNELSIDEAYSGLLPEEKAERLEKIKASEGTSLFVGDGINDAPVLSLADAGIAMGRGTDVAIGSADVVLLSDRLSAVCDAIGLSRKTLSVARFNIFFGLSIKAVVLILGALGVSTMWHAVFADVGVSVLSVLNAARLLKSRP
jgi:Cd2+/Zn2+-exporting ATPase